MTGFDIGTGMRRLVNCVAEYLPNTQVLVVCPPPVVETGVLAEMFTGAADRGRTMPENMLRICRETGAGFFDAGTVIQTDPIDGIHYSAAAQVALGRALDPEVRKILAA